MKEERNYIAGVVRHYSSLFSFPSYRSLLIYMFISVLLIVTTAFLIVSFATTSVFRGLVFGLQALLVPTICADLVSSHLSRDVILNLRRTTALSTVTTAAWAFIAAAGLVFQARFGVLGLTRSFFLGASLVVGFRFVVVRSITSLRPLGFVTSVLLSPMLCVGVTSVLLPLSPSLVLTSLTSITLLLLTGEAFLRIIDRRGKKTVGVGSIHLFRGFILDWLVGIAAPLEEHLEKMASPVDASASLMEFSHSTEPHGIIVVSDIHPGPFKNVGSSNIPYEIQAAFENRMMALAMVPHGTSGHERDLASRKYCDRLVQNLVEATNFGNFSELATRMVRCTFGRAQASCQFFGCNALVTLTCAPQSMEDIPFELGEEIRALGKNLGAGEVVVIDAHNSIGKAEEMPVLLPGQLNDLRSAAELAIKEALRANRAGFRFGASHVVPKEFGLNEGLGQGGISVAVVEVQNQKAAYVTLDGNNMLKGLREQVLAVLSDLVDESEVLATDTHAVNAISMVDRGYHPIGEVGNREILLYHIRKCTTDALSRLQESRLALKRVTVPKVLVIGREKLRGLSLLVDSSVTLSKYMTVLIYGPVTLLTTLMFLFFP